MNKWLSMKEICQYLGISRDTALRWIKNNDMPAHKIERMWRFDTFEIDEWVKNNGSK